MANMRTSSENAVTSLHIKQCVKSCHHTTLPVTCQSHERIQQEMCASELLSEHRVLLDDTDYVLHSLPVIIDMTCWSSQTQPKVRGTTSTKKCTLHLLM
jgi:hypothetical protein